MIVERAEKDSNARSIQDDARRIHGVLVAHMGDDPMSALPLVRHLREAGVVALQMDRVPAGSKAREVKMFGARGRMPEGPLRLAVLSGAPILPIFSSRLGSGRYEIVVGRAVRLRRAVTKRRLALRLSTLQMPFVLSSAPVPRSGFTSAENDRPGAFPEAVQHGAALAMSTHWHIGAKELRVPWLLTPSASIYSKCA